MGLICTFTCGYCDKLWVSDETLATELADTLEALNGIPTELVFLPTNGATYWCKVSHTLAHRGKLEPASVFVGAVTDAVFQVHKNAAEQEWELAQQEAKRMAVELRKAWSQKIKWSDLTDRQKQRLEGVDLSHHDCWLWKPMRSINRKSDDRPKVDEAPYRDFFLELRGPLPRTILLRHKCDNRMCMNPNHLVPGTHKQNARDMTRRGRHAHQRNLAAKAIRRMRKALQARNKALSRVWTPKRLEQLYLLSKRRYSPARIAATIGFDVTAKDVETQWRSLKAEMHEIVRREKERRKKLRLEGLARTKLLLGIR